MTAEIIFFVTIHYFLFFVTVNCFFPSRDSTTADSFCLSCATVRPGALAWVVSVLGEQANGGEQGDFVKASNQAYKVETGFNKSTNAVAPVGANGDKLRPCPAVRCLAPHAHPPSTLLQPPPAQFCKYAKRSPAAHGLDSAQVPPFAVDTGRTGSQPNAKTCVQCGNKKTYSQCAGCGVACGASHDALLAAFPGSIHPMARQCPCFFFAQTHKVDCPFLEGATAAGTSTFVLDASKLPQRLSPTA